MKERIFISARRDNQNRKKVIICITRNIQCALRLRRCTQFETARGFLCWSRLFQSKRTKWQPRRTINRFNIEFRWMEIHSIKTIDHSLCTTASVFVAIIASWEENHKTMVQTYYGIFVGIHTKFWVGSGSNADWCRISGFFIECITIIISISDFYWSFD